MLENYIIGNKLAITKIKSLEFDSKFVLFTYCYVLVSIVALEKSKEKQLEEGNTVAIEKGKKVSSQFVFMFVCMSLLYIKFFHFYIV